MREGEEDAFFFVTDLLIDDNRARDAIMDTTVIAIDEDPRDADEREEKE